MTQQILEAVGVLKVGQVGIDQSERLAEVFPDRVYKRLWAIRRAHEISHVPVTRPDT